MCYLFFLNYFFTYETYGTLPANYSVVQMQRQVLYESEITLLSFLELASLLANQLRALRARWRPHIWLRTLRKLQERKCDVALTHNKNGKAI